MHLLQFDCKKYPQQKQLKTEEYSKATRFQHFLS